MKWRGYEPLMCNKMKCEIKNNVWKWPMKWNKICYEQVLIIWNEMWEVVVMVIQCKNDK